MESWSRVVVLGAAVAALAGCLDEEISIDLREDGSGTAVVSGRMTEAATGIIALVDEPGGGTIDFDIGPDDFSFQEPDDAAREAMGKQGLRVKECVSRRDDKEVSARLAVDFDRVGSLAFVEGMRRRRGTPDKKSPVGKPLFELSPAAEGTWSLAFSTPLIQLSGGSAAIRKPGEELDTKKMRRKLEAVAKLAQEGLKGKGKITLAVPGEVLEASPESGLTRGKRRCAWELDVDGLFNTAVAQGWDPNSGDGSLPPVTFKVRFRLPAGKSFPDQAPVVAAPEGGQANARERFQAELSKVYNYLPADVDFRVRKAKVAEMEGFWNFVKSDLGAYLPLLREALRDEKQNRYFLYDGGGLMLEIARTREDRQLGMDAASRCRLEDVGEKGYFSFCHRFGREDVDAYAAIVKMLEKPDFSVSVPMHSMVLHQDLAVLLCLLENKEEHWVERFVKRVPVEKNEHTACTILFCLVNAVTPEADAAVRAVSNDNAAARNLRMVANICVQECRPPSLPSAPPTKTRRDFEEFLAKAEKDGRLPVSDAAEALKAEALHHVQAADGPRIRELRRLTAQRVSDEALLEIEFLTGLLRRAAALGK